MAARGKRAKGVTRYRNPRQRRGGRPFQQITNVATRRPHARDWARRRTRQRPDAVFVLTDNSLYGLAGPIIVRAMEAHVPTVGSFDATFAQLGGLYAYGRDPKEAYYGVARLLKKILDGASPAEIPFEQPTKFNLYINLKTARSLGIEIPPTLLAIADDVIE